MQEQDIYFKSIHDFLAVFPNEQACIDHLTQTRWNGNVVSPFDPESKVYVCKLNRYKCKNTGKYFNVKTGTIFEDTNMPLMKWFMALYVFSSHKKGISSHQLARDLDITQKSAWFMLHRLRYAFNVPTEKLEGIVEADCTFVGGKNSNKHKKKRDEANANGTGAVNKTPVFGMVQRDGKLVTGVVAKEDQENLRPLIRRWVEVGSTLVTDGHGAYKHIAGVKHESVAHEKGEYARQHFHTAHIDGFWSQFKRGIIGIYHQISEKHTNAYAQEFTLRHNTRKFSTSSRFDYILTNMVGRLKYNTLTA
ncbi:IS1595 family transposase [Mucilaginibacter terrae]|uniref:Transposase-like protein n=1 Tax=Mucilaginibacter terrae TaxID=1955052 RepID=A0ABU3GUU3_9SPHI|nr:IS1595 family transposase [Mucilaginibacter terrae]MDT3403547.1 transposase-like protein [Mucilaginibacter terrae]